MIEFSGIGKSFGPVQVLRDISFALAPGHTLGLVGENGAGKSTLMNLVGGVLRPDSGEMRLEGKTYSPRNARDAARHGIALIHQELNLFPNLTIAENLFLTSFPTGALGSIDRKQTSRRASAALEKVGLTLSPQTLVEKLSAGERQLVEVARALSQDARLLLFDEPTTSLSAKESLVLFRLLEGLRKRGLSIIYISHALEDVLRLADDVVVLRDGQVVGSGPRPGFDLERMVSLMVGRSLTQLYPERKGAPGQETILEARALTRAGMVRQVSFCVHRGEIVGLSGLLGAGRSELARILFGLEPVDSGEVLLENSPLGQLGPDRRIERGLGFLTEERREDGLCMEGDIASNLSLVSLRRFARCFPWLLRGRELARELVSLRSAVCVSPRLRDAQPVRTLSGGNQQKVVLGKWLMSKPSVLILDEPTRGIDIGARCEIYQLILDLADRGTAVLIISSELEELLGLCDRILVMARGEIRDELRRAQFDRERILRAAIQSAPIPRAPE